MKSNFFKLITFCCILAFIACKPTSKEREDVKADVPEFRDLFNGKDFSGWETWIGVPHPSVMLEGLARNEAGEYTEPLGLNNDPLNVFSITEVEGEPALHVSGQVYGAFATTEQFESYHFRLEVKWGDAKWAPREDLPRNSGLLYHGTGEYGAGLEVWKNSHECQIMEGMFGDSYRMGDTWCEIKASRPSPDERYMFDPNAELVAFGPDEEAGKICSKNPGNEKPLGMWNLVEIICVGDTSIHIINGKVNMVNYNSKLVGETTKSRLAKGNIQLQSEGAEVFYRRMQIKEVSRIPDEYREFL
ncbi:MAG: DUF1080 domain-containing protein [Cyclobacteriaceae bacterium]|nr:DUF1080 domain-containing protein [Cyclobacteriaceae bacterium]